MQNQNLVLNFENTENLLFWTKVPGFANSRCDSALHVRSRVNKIWRCTAVKAVISQNTNRTVRHWQEHMDCTCKIGQ